MVKAVEQKEGRTVVEMTTVSPVDGQTRSQTVAVTERGVDLVANTYERWTPSVPVLRVPPEPAGKLAFESTETNTGRRQKGTLTTHPEEEVSTPAGRYRAIRTELTSLDGEASVRLTNWYSKGVGWVRGGHSITHPSIKLDSEWVLESFTPGKP